MTGVLIEGNPWEDGDASPSPQRQDPLICMLWVRCDSMEREIEEGEEVEELGRGKETAAGCGLTS